MASDRQPGQSPAPDHNTDNHKTDPDLAATNAVIEEAEILHASIKAGTVAQIVVAVIAVIGLLYLLKLVMVTTLVAILLAFVLEPLVGRLPRIGIPRPVWALLAVVLMITLAGALTYFFYNRAVDFATQLPKYSAKIRTALSDVRMQGTSGLDLCLALRERDV